MINTKIIKAIAAKESRYLFKERTFFLLLGVFIVMAALSTFIGWSALHTIKNVYKAAAVELSASGQPIPGFPLQNLSSLAIIKNMIIYIVLIGSLLSIILGYFIGINDRVAGTVKLIFSRPVKKSDLLLGKFLAVSRILGFIVSAAFIISLASAGLFQTLSLANGIRIFGFYALSFFYMLGFAMLALALAIKMDSSASALLYSLFIWVAITFALPELSSALYPTSSLNPVLPPTAILDSPILKSIRTVVYPFSVSEHFKELSSAILGVAAAPDGQPIGGHSFINLAVIILWSLFSGLAAFLFFKKIKPGQSDLYE